MTDKVISFSEFMTDKDGDYSKARFLSTAQALLAEGRSPERVFRAMLRAAYQASIEHSISEHYAFLRDASADINEWKTIFEAQIDKYLDQKEEE